jgi:Mg2+ and Co2+ transporter CorA
LQVVDFDFSSKVEKNIDISEVAGALAAGRFIWIDVEAGNVPEAQLLLGELKIVTDEIIQDALTSEAATRHARYDDCIHVVVSGCHQRGLHFDLERVDIVIAQSFLITIHKGPVAILSAVRRDYKQDFQRFAKIPS